MQFLNYQFIYDQKPTIDGTLIRYLDGSQYIGDVYNKLPNGNGIYQFIDNTVINGQF